MKLLVRSTLRYLKQHFFQTFLTAVVTILITAIMSVVFYFASGFQSLLREYALHQEGTYHYKYYTQKGSDSADLLYRMAEQLQEDHWFSSVDLTEDESNVNLFLMVKSPGLFTSKIMENKLKVFQKEYYASHNGALVLSAAHNLNLLASYGDLNEGNGLYTYLRIFLFLYGVTGAVSVLTLKAVYGASASRRERDFALLKSVGADDTQIRHLVLMESMIYIIAAIPAGSLLGIAFFQASRKTFDRLLYLMGIFPPIRLVINVPFLVALVLSASGIILLSGFLSARKAAATSPMALLRGEEELFLPKRDRDNTSQGDSAVRKLLGAEAWMAVKSHRRFKARNRATLLALSVTLVLCFVLTGFCRYATETVEMTRSGISYNICIDLRSDNLESMNRLAENLRYSSQYQLKSIREVCFSLREPYYFSQYFISSAHAGRTGMLPDIMLVGVEEEILEDVCKSIGME